MFATSRNNLRLQAGDGWGVRKRGSPAKCEGVATPASGPPAPAPLLPADQPSPSRQKDRSRPLAAVASTDAKTATGSNTITLKPGHLALAIGEFSSLISTQTFRHCRRGKFVTKRGGRMPAREQRQVNSSRKSDNCRCLTVTKAGYLRQRPRHHCQFSRAPEITVSRL